MVKDGGEEKKKKEDVNQKIQKLKIMILKKNEVENQK